MGNWGCVIGTVMGVFLFAPWGIIFGPFVGALLGELLGGKNLGGAMKAGAGAFFVFLVSVVLKVGLCGYFAYCMMPVFSIGAFYFHVEGRRLSKETPSLSFSVFSIRRGEWG